jgi:hypothetical protein
MARTPLFALALGLLAAAGPASPAAPDWGALRDVDTVVVVTSDEDASARETTVWLAVVDGSGYVRTGSTRWGDNALRSPELVLRVGEASYPVRIEFVEDEAQRQRVADAFREKYGWSDAALSWLRGGHPKLMRLLPKQ